MQPHTSLSNSFLRALAITSLSLGALAQSPTCPPSYNGDIFVDAQFGSDTSTYPSAGCPARPFKTITYALTQAPTTQPITIIVNPGVYDTANGETFPLNMKRNVSIQGTNAVNTVIQAPIIGFGDCESASLINPQPNALIKFDAQQSGAFDNVNLDSLCINGACIGIAITGSFPANPTISNCFISDTGMSGIDIMSEDEEIHRPKVIHCTFALNHVSITNRTSGTTSGKAPSNPPSKPGLLNVLSAMVSNGSPDFFGIRREDMRNDNNGTLFTDSSSGFDLASSAGLGASTPPNTPGFSWGTFSANNPNARLFVEQAVFTTAFVGADMRINPAMAGETQSLIDGAYRPDEPAISWMNGTTGSYSQPNGSLIDDWDCEGFGNPRYSGGLPDMGADDVGTYTLAGYQRFTTDFTPGMTTFTWVGPFTATNLPQWLTSKQVTATTSTLYIDSGESAPNCRALRTDLPFTVPSHLHDCYLLASQIVTNAFSITNSPNPLQGTAPSVLFQTLFNVQSRFPELGSIGLSNLQTFTVTPP
jgi:hypothetical protein